MEKSLNINAIIVDDEKGCITNLQHYLAKLCPGIRVVGTGGTLKEAMGNALGTKIDLAFLDIELFDDNIFSALATIENINFKIVFVTAHQQYAIKAIKIEALEYILKPLLEDDILDCYSKIKKHFSSAHGESEVPDTQHPEKKNKKIIIKNSDKIYIIRADDIYLITGSGFYSEITFLFDGEIKSVVISKPLNKVEEEYHCSFFFRVHKSYVINVNKMATVIKGDGLNIRMANGQIVPVAKRRANEFMTFLNTD